MFCQETKSSLKKLIRIMLTFAQASTTYSVQVEIYYHAFYSQWNPRQWKVERWELYSLIFNVLKSHTRLLFHGKYVSMCLFISSTQSPCMGRTRVGQSLTNGNKAVSDMWEEDEYLETFKKQPGKGLHRGGEHRHPTVSQPWQWKTYQMFGLCSGTL